MAEMAERAGRHYRQSTASWLEAAGVLLEARAIAQHGDWMQFLAAAGIPPRTASRMLDFARSGIQIGHVAVLGIRYIDQLIAASRRNTANAIEYARSDPHLMEWQLTPQEIAADEWEFAGGYVQAVIDIIPELGPEELNRNGFDAATVRRAEAA